MGSFKQASDTAINGTSLRGHIDVSYNDLVKVFGDPHSSGDEYKIDAEWMLEFSDGTIASIYNYKDGVNYCGLEEGTPTEEIRDWHIGGLSTKSVLSVRKALSDALTSSPPSPQEGLIRVLEAKQKVLVEALEMVSNFNWKNNRKHLLEIVDAALAKAKEDV